jgi:predicted DsbA family dithiol-disulfide isomerase
VFYPLHPNTPDEGIELTELFAGRNMDIDAMKARMKMLMQAEGLEYGDRTRTYNSRLAQELGKWADQAGYPQIHDAFYRTYFVEGTNLARIDDLVKVAERVGLPGGEARRVLETRALREAVDADWARARALGITGVPTFVAGRRGVVGAQPYEMLESLVVSAGARRREGIATETPPEQP